MEEVIAAWIVEVRNEGRRRENEKMVSYASIVRGKKRREKDEGAEDKSRNIPFLGHPYFSHSQSNV